MVDSSFYAGIFVESGARPNIVSNTLHGGDTAAKLGPATTVNRGLGVLFILGAKGLLGKNQFEDFTVAPVMVFTRLVFSNCDNEKVIFTIHKCFLVLFAVAMLHDQW